MQRYFSNKLNNNKFILNNDDIYHITRVMRMKDNDKIEVVYEKEVYLCGLSFNNDIEVNVIKKVEDYKEDNIQITLIVPLLKENKMDLILQKSTELGVSKIIPVVMERSIIKLDKDKEYKKIERWTKICKEASEQSMRVTIPIITEIKNLKDLIELDGLKIICSTKEKNNTIKSVLMSDKGYKKINIVVGPEGGITEKEEKYLSDNGFIPITLGSRIMRVETVPLFILSVLNYENMN